MSGTKNKTHSVITLVLFKLCWLAIVFSAVWVRPWIGLAAIAGFTVYETVLRGRSHVLLPAVVVGLLGFTVDNLYAVSALITFRDTGFALAPYWMALLWVNFALIVEQGLSFLRGRPVLAAALGAIGGPMAYMAGVRLELLELTAPPVVALGVIALTWALAMPLMLHFLRGPAQRADELGGYASTD